MTLSFHYDIVVIGGGHAGAEAAWASANLGAKTASITMDSAHTGAMSYNLKVPIIQLRLITISRV